MVCSRETGWAWDQRCRQGLFEVSEFSFIQSRIGSHRMGFQQTSHLSSFDFCFKGISAVQCAYSLNGYFTLFFDMVHLKFSL